MTGQNAVERMTTGALGAWRTVGRIPTKIRIAIRDYQDTRAEQVTRAQGPSIKQRHEDLVGFYTQYESLVELLCDSAQYGPDSKHEERYATLRTWMQSNYPLLRPYAVAFLQYDVVDARQSLDWLGVGADAFEALFAAPTLAEFVRRDDGAMIWRIERTRTALNVYGEHLRHLLAEERACE